MIFVYGEVGGKAYEEPFSKGVLARSLTRAELDPNIAHTFASVIESELIEKNIKNIHSDDLVEIVYNKLKEEIPEFAEKYVMWRNIKNKSEPLIILIGGSSGIGTSSIAFEIASRLGIRSLTSTDMVREVMRKIVSKELAPVIHRSSYNAFESLRIKPSPESDEVIVGFKEQVSLVSIGVEAIIERAITEGISMVMEGVHIVPGFINEDLMKKNNVIMIILTLTNEDMHKNRFRSRCRQKWARRPLQRYMDNLPAIRRINTYFQTQAKKNDVPLIENIDVVSTVDTIIKEIYESYGVGENDEEYQSKGCND